MKKIFLILFLIFSFFQVNAAENIVYKGKGTYILRERSDFRRYDNGKYVGLVNQEVSSYITPVEYDNYYLYEGSFYIQQSTRRNFYSVSQGLDDAILSSFRIDKSGKLTMLEDNGFPTFRSFPSFSDKRITPGDVWEAKAERAVDPLNKGIITKMPIYVQYKYLRDDYFNNEPVFVISAVWATRYGMGTGNYYIDWGGDKELKKATGTHKATLYVSKATGNSLLIQDLVDETFVYSDENQYTFKGTISLFTEYPPAIDRTRIIPALKRIAKISDEEAEKLKTPLSETEETYNYSSLIGSEIAMANSNDFNENNTLTNEIISSAMTKNNSGNNHSSKSADNSELTSTFSKSNSKNFANKITESESSFSKPKATTQNEGNISSSFSSKSTPQTSVNTKNNENSIDSSFTKNTKNTNQNSNEKINEITSTITKKNSNNKENTTTELVTVDNTPAGIRLTIPDLKFQANSAELLLDEKDRLNKIAEVLLEIPDCKFLIEGHTAAVGLEKGEMQLSIERANSIAKEFIKRGIPKDRFICRGSGGTKPIADNATPEGKAKNRRVEITILD